MQNFLLKFLFWYVYVNTAIGKLVDSTKIAPKVDIPMAWSEMNATCVNAMQQQIQKEFDACYVYLAMAAHFSQDTINRPGIADGFFEAAREEREHGTHLIEYLAMRGQIEGRVCDFFKVPHLDKFEWEDAADALQDALVLEAQVTESINELIKTCEAEPNDYHLVDFLTGVYLEEQLNGQRKLAGQLVTLMKLMRNNGELAEFLYDKALQGGTIH